MFPWFILTAVLFITVSAVEEKLLLFNRNGFFKCLEYNLVSDDDFNSVDINAIKEMAGFIARRFIGKKLNKSDFNRYVSYLFYYLQKRKSYLFQKV